MTTVTGAGDKTLKRIDALRQVKASVRGLSIEPLWERIPPEKLDLTGIDWVIVGGESGSGDLTRPFALEWAEELREHCRKNGIAFFFKQFGRNPSRNGEVFRLKDRHGGEWEEWDESLRTREFPAHFHQYRAEEKMDSKAPRRRTSKAKGKPTTPEAELATPEEKEVFKRLDKLVRKGVEAFEQAGEALFKIHEDKLWKAGGHKSWDDYCRTVAGMSRGHAHRLLKASECMAMLKTSPIGDVLPVSESQVRPLLRLSDPAQQAEAWIAAVQKAEGHQPTAGEVTVATFEILHPDGPGEKPVSRARQRVELFSRLKEVIHTKKSWEQVEKLLEELEALL